MRNFTKLANLHRVFFKKAEGPLSAGPRPSVPEGVRPPVPPAPPRYKAPEQVYRPKLTNSGSNSMLYTPGMEQFPAPSDYGPPRARHSAPADSGEPRSQLNYAPTPKPWQPPKPGPYDPINAIEQQAQASRSKQLEDENNFANPLGWRIPDPVSFKDHVGQFLGMNGSPKGKVNLYSPLESKGRPIPPSQARPELPFGDSYQYKHLARPPFTMPTTPTSDLQ
jgi:hypothetical protein